MSGIWSYMKLNMQAFLGLAAVCLCLAQPAAFAQTTDEHDTNLANCTYFVGPCDHSRLTPTEAAAVAAIEHQRNTVDCRNGWESCDRSRLTPEEASALAVALHRRNVENCTDGYG